MLFISHRGNLMGPNPTVENHPSYVLAALEAGYDVEIDIWWHNDQFYLGHDEPLFPLPPEFRNGYSEKLWFHCKNVEALLHISYFPGLKYFWHEEDDVTLTSNRKIWTYPGKKLVPGSIAVMPEKAYDGDLWSCSAICTDMVLEYERMYESRNIN